jgi:hypothetical protein
MAGECVELGEFGVSFHILDRVIRYSRGRFEAAKRTVTTCSDSVANKRTPFCDP